MRHVLLADDDEDVRALLCVMLAKAGFRPEAYGNGRAALQAAQNQPFEFYLLDVRMPELAGLEVCRALKANPRTTRRPVLLVSAETSEDDIAAGLLAGASYLSKPFTSTELIRCIDQIVGVGTRPPGAARIPTALRAHAHSPAWVAGA